MRKVSKHLLPLAILAVFGIHWVRAAELPVMRWDGRTMGSPYTVQIVGINLSPKQTGQLKQDIEARLRAINRQMSHYQSDSELSQFNRAPANQPFKVSPEFARVTRFSLELSSRSQGVFDPTLTPLINLWGFGEKSEVRAVPAADALAAAQRVTGWRHLKVSDRDELTKGIPELGLNLSAVAKGFGVDEMIRVLAARGFTNVYASIAGEVRVLGRNSRAQKWLVGVSSPVDFWNENDSFEAVAALSNQAISTSGDYQKFFTDSEGRRLCHILDPRTGWPVQNRVGGVSVVAPDSMTADALGTILFILGPEAGLKFIADRPDVSAMFILREPDGAFRRVASSNFPFDRTAP